MTINDENESPRIEIEISVVLLGFIFVMYSIFLTMPSEVLITLKQIGIRISTGTGDNIIIAWINSADVFSAAGLYCALSLLGAILFYLLFLRSRKEAILLTARSLLAFGLLLSVILLMLINELYSARLVGATQVNATISHFTGLIASFSLIAAIAYIVWSWGSWLYRNIRARSLQKQSQATSVNKTELENG